MDAAVLAANCAPFVDPHLLVAIARVESRGSQYIINVNSYKDKKGGKPVVEVPKGTYKPIPKSRAEAVSVAKRLISYGYSIDMGVLQINSENLPALQVTLDNVFDPCYNFYIGATILWRFHNLAVKKSGGASRNTLMQALSAYNTGNFSDGFNNGYVQRIVDSVNYSGMERSLRIN